MHFLRLSNLQLAPSSVQFVIYAVHARHARRACQVSPISVCYAYVYNTADKDVSHGAVDVVDNDKRDATVMTLMMITIPLCNTPQYARFRTYRFISSSFNRLARELGPTPTTRAPHRVFHSLAFPRVSIFREMLSYVYRTRVNKSIDVLFLKKNVEKLFLHFL